MKTRFLSSLSLVMAVALLPVRLLPAEHTGRVRYTRQDTQLIQRISLACSGIQADAQAVDASISADGRYVAFESQASNLVDGDTNEADDGFVYDRRTGHIDRVSVASDGTQADDESSDVTISASGRYVTFASFASNLVSGDTNGLRDVFVHDRETGQTTRASVASDGGQTVFYGSDEPVLSSDGRYVAFSSQSEMLAPVDTTSRANIFLRDRQTRETTCISRPTSGTQQNLSSVHPSISADGRYVAFSSAARNLVTGDTNDERDVFVYDVQTGEIVRVSIASDGTEGNGDSEAPEISADGRYVAFRSAAYNLVSGDTNQIGPEEIFFHDRDADNDGVLDEPGQISTTRVSIASDGTQVNQQCWNLAISGDGRYVAFDTWSDTLVNGDTNEAWDVFVRDTQAGVTTRVSVASDGDQADDNARRPSLSYDGTSVAFDASATNLVGGDTNGVQDVFVHGDWAGQRRFAGEIAPIYPTSHGSDSSVMEGGEMARHLRVLCADGTTPVPFA